MPLDALILLDTNIILQLVRNNMMSQQLEADYRLISRPNGNLISICDSWRNVCAFSQTRLG